MISLKQVTRSIFIGNAISIIVTISTILPSDLANAQSDAIFFNNKAGWRTSLIGSSDTMRKQIGRTHLSEGEKLTLICPSNPDGRIPSYGVYGTNLYNGWSSVCNAAVHQGIIDFKNGGRVTIIIQKPAKSYQGSTRNGVKSFNAHPLSSRFSFSFVPTQN
jgi:hypothetical protein